MFILIVIFSLSGCKLPWDTSDAPVPIIHIVPQNQSISLGEKFPLEIRADNVSYLFATPFYLLYDTNFLKFDSAAEGTFLNQNNMDSTTFLFSNDSTRGRITIGLTRLGQVPGVSGSGLLMTVYFGAINKGASNIDFANASARIVTENDFTPGVTTMSFIGATINVQ